MKKADEIPQDASSWERIVRYWPTIRETGRRILLWLCVIVFVLFEWHIVPPELVSHEGLPRQIILSALVVLGAGIVELLFDTRVAVRRVSNDVKQLTENASTKLNSLQGCLADLSGVLNTVPS